MAKKQKDDNVQKQDFDKLSKELEGLKELSVSLESQLKRAVADYQNLEKRVAEGRSELTSWAATELIRKLLTVLAHFEKALMGATEQDRESGWFKGVELATGQLKQVLKDEGLDEIVADGQFDPSLHEAVDAREPSSDEALEGKGDNSILEVVEKGYNLNGKVIKPAKVVVGRKE